MAKTKIPVPGAPVRGSKSGAPIMALFDLLGRRWAMGILWTSCERGALSFRGLEEACESISPSVLNQRLKELQAAGLMERGEEGYQATDLGREIYDLLVPLGAVAKRWGKLLESEG